MMKQLVIRTCGIAALLSTCIVIADALPYLSFRSQGFNAARELVGWQTQINKYGMCCNYGSFSVTPEYGRSFRPREIAECLFGKALYDTCCQNIPTVKIQGSKVKIDQNALMAENFYLPTDFSSEFTLEPRIDNCLVDINMYLGLDECAQGMYFRIHAPVTWTRWDLNFCENVLNPGQNSYDPGYFNNTFTPANDYNDPDVYGLSYAKLLHSFSDYIVEGKGITNVPGMTYSGLRHARIAPCGKNSLTRIAELTAALGWNFISCPDYHFGLQIRAAAPTGNRPEGTWLFEPIVGQGHHWELGAGITSRCNICKSDDECRSFDVYVDANLTHLFKTNQCRTFDLCGKPLGRYMLAMKFTTDVQNLTALDNGTFTPPATQFANVFTPVANLTTIPVQVSAAVQGELALKFALTNNCFQWDIGYDFWARSCEKIHRNCDCPCESNFKNNTWGLKGNAFVYGFPLTLRGISPNGIPLSATQNQATVFGGLNNYADPETWAENLNIDNPDPAYMNSAAPLYTHTIDTFQNPEVPQWNFVNTSYQPVLLEESMIDFDGARSRGISHKVFTHFGYLWKNCECWTPYLGLGGQIEFAQHDQDCCKPCNPCKKTSCDKSKDTQCCNTCALSQWGVWVKAGISFNS